MTRTMRQARIDLATPAEQKIREAMAAVEALPADTRLTNAVIALSAALENVGAYVNEQLAFVVGQRSK
jgi:hypothetical protein